MKKYWLSASNGGVVVHEYDEGADPENFWIKGEDYLAELAEKDKEIERLKKQLEHAWIWKVIP